MNRVQGKRLGRSYNVKASKQRSHTLNETKQSLQDICSTPGKSQPEAVIIHSGINDLKTRDPPEMCKSFVPFLKEIARKNPNVKFIVSKITAVKEKKTEVKRQLFNAILSSELYDVANISFVDNSNIKAYHLRDNFHLTPKGTSLLAGNVGRHARDLLWETPRKPSRSGRHYHHPPFPILPQHQWFNRFDAMRDWPAY
eukprot:TRINITY_DN20892_c1_g1_i1.p2 TRINITY_DN20892_c1_g1~~TRINITY_DN20892_c1_g1_i1.p2  ORF type:complete len:198 (-),score=27.63 TRINITY_DN20892_c1_g1_i1:2039-2632(-)